MHPDSIRKSFNVGKYSGYEVYKFMQNKIESNLISDEESIRLETLRDKEFKERVRLQDANREKRKYLREFSRLESILEYIDKKLDDREPIKIEQCNYIVPNGNEASVMLSDLHLGAKVDNTLNFYDLDEAKSRMSEFSDKVIAYCKMASVNDLKIEILGDCITGTIHGSLVSQSVEDVLDQIFDAVELIEYFVKKIAKEVNVTNIYCCSGNHGAISSAKSDRTIAENFERIIPRELRKDLSKTTIKVIDSKNDDFICYQLKDGRNIVVAHGTNDNKQTANSVYSKMLGIDIFEVHIGHLHSCAENDGTIVNGSVIGTDEFAMTIRKNTKAQQLMRVYIGNDVMSCKFTLG